jgi:hypothetical protein
VRPIFPPPIINIFITAFFCLTLNNQVILNKEKSLFDSLTKSKPSLKARRPIIRNNYILEK